MPELTEKQIAARPLIIGWLLFVAALIFVMVIIGGATRLTGSGLSITEWKPIMGAIPPLNLADWQDAFEKYKEIPQYLQVNKGMSLEEFKSIFWWEWAHRFFGRFIGVAFLLPFLFFLATGRVEKNLRPKLWLLFALGGLQGFIGWYMVASGLVGRTDVSQYRLALHLGLAVFIFAALIWIAMNLYQKSHQARAATRAAKPVRLAAFAISALIFLQIIAGAFVAGMKAGFAYNTWPLMNGHFIPNGLGAMSPAWRNLFENALTVQFNHRILAYLVAIAVFAHLVQVLRQRGEGQRGEGQLSSAAILAVVTVGQIFLGIMTLVHAVPLDLALAHQGGALILLTAALWHSHRISQ